MDQGVPAENGCGLAYGVDPHRAERYSLRQARYDAAAQDISNWAAAAAQAGGRLTVLDVGCGTGTLLRHLEAKPHFASLVISATNFYERWTYKPEIYEELFICDLARPVPRIPSDAYDIVVCEQVLEHLADPDTAIALLVRVTKPGGRLIVGVPIFLPPLHLVRRHIVPRLDRMLGRRESRGHVQAFSLASFLQRFDRYDELTMLDVRGFRIISGGVLRPLENYRWYWKANRLLGHWLPAACTEVQAVMVKSVLHS